MKKRLPFLACLLLLAVALPFLVFSAPAASMPSPAHQSYPPPNNPPPQGPAQPVFRFPVVPGSTISGYFDHNQGDDLVTFYDGRKNALPFYGFYFSCPSVGMYDFVGCEDPVSGEGACRNEDELWYDGHRGIDMEYSSGWHTGAVCDPGRFAGITSPVYAPAPGKVHFAGYDPYRPGNGWHIRLKHDLNRNGNYDDDNFRSIYLHFTANALAVRAGQVVGEGQYLGLGGSTGYSSSPHLHFEIQRSNDYFSNTFWSVDPYGWQGAGDDPWPYQNVRLWRVSYDNLDKKYRLPLVMKQAEPQCTTCGGALITNGGFENGPQGWVEVGVDILSRYGQGSLRVVPYAGDWLAWLGGRDNAADVLYQPFTLPDGKGEVELRYVLRVDTEEGAGVYDVLNVRLRDANGGLIKELDSVDNTFSPRAQWVNRTIRVTDLGSWGGQGLRLNFEARTDNSAKTSFFVDNVDLVTP